MKNHIQHLLDKYFDEQTTSREEAELRAYFAGEVHPDLEVYKSVFAVVNEEREMTLGAGFEAKLFGNIMGDLTEKYFAGETTVAEENDLRAYYADAETAPALQPYRDWFNYLQIEKQQEVSADFTERLLAQIEGQASTDITALAEKYFAGETTIAEENRLKDYFNAGDVAPELQKYQSWFTFLTDESRVGTSADFAERVLRDIKGQSAGLRVVSRRRNFMRVAAGLALLVGMLFFLQRSYSDKIGYGDAVAETVENTEIDWSKYEVKTEAEARAETEEAMRLLAKAFGKSTKKAGNELHKVGEATKILN